MTLRRASLGAFVCLVLAAAAPAAWGSTKFHPRIRGALGLAPPVTQDGRFGTADIASGLQIPETYHGGTVMAGGVTVHTIFWDGGTNPFQGQPAGAPHDYVGMIQQFFTDVAADSGATSNAFSVLPQFAEGTTPGGVTPGDYSIHYNSLTDSIADHHPYPGKSDQCASPQSTSVCVTDAQVQAEVDRVITATGGSRGLHDIWYVFLPPDVDECILPGICGTDAFGGYHSLSNLGHGVAIYALTIDPIIETRRVNNPGDDPEGYPDAELVIDIAAHETVEAMTDPEGVGWMDPNGFEVGDKCEFGPQFGTPLGFAPNGSPYNQVINGDKYLFQEMWANHDNAGNPDCVQRTTNTTNDLPLPQISMRQFSSTVSGNIERSPGGGVGVRVSLIRAASDGSSVTVAQGSTTTAADGSWSVSLGSHALGDDRDEIDIDYSGANAPSPSHEVILTGNGGNPFTESGWTGWTDLDNGSFLTNNPSLGGPSLTVGPCFQTGVFHATLNGAPAPSPTDFCNTQTDTATVSFGAPVSPGSRITQGSNDNRGFQDPNLPTANPTGALVDLTVPVGEPDAVSMFVNPLPTFAPSGFPTCTADLQPETVTCTGLVPSSSYTVLDTRSGESHSGSADGTGTVSVAFAPGALKGGDALDLSNGARTLTTLHVANLRADIVGGQTVLSGGSCQPGEYFAPPLSSAPTSLEAGAPTVFVGGAALTDEICPASGDATGFAASPIVQTDEFSQGQTQTEVPDIEDTSPMQGEIVYGAFTALAESGLPGPNGSITSTDATSRISLSIRRDSGGRVVFKARNVDTANGVVVRGLKKGTYKATWKLTDDNGDTRTITTRFVEQKGAGGAKPALHCTLLSGGKKVRCTVRYRSSGVAGKLRMRLSHGKLLALGHGRVRHGRATITLRSRRHLARGTYTATLVLGQAHASSTAREKVRVR